MKFNYYQNTDRWETMHFKTWHYRKCLLILMSWNYFRNTAHEFWYTLYYAWKSQSVLPAGFNSNTGFLLVTWRCANIACRFNGQIYLKKLILSFNKILLLSIRHKQRCGFTAEFTIVFVSQKNKITKKMSVVYTVSELESSTGCICGNISVWMVRFIVRTNLNS